MNIIYAWGKSICPTFKKEKDFLEEDQLESLIGKAETDEQIDQISCGLEHCFIKSKNKLFAFGNNSHGQLGIQSRADSDVDICKVFINSKKPIVRISCGWHHTLALDQTGDVFSCGKGDEGALGYGIGENSYSFKKVLGGARKISAGKDHSLALCGTKVFGWGNSKEGQLGFLKKKIYFQPKQLNIYSSQDIFAGAKYSIFNTSKGIFATGVNNNCQLGLGHQNNVFTPKRLGIEQKIIQIKGGNYCIAITVNNECYLWGNGGFGLYKYPTKLNFFTDFESISIGLNFGIMKKQGGKGIMVWGTNRYGELGIRSSEGKEYAVQSTILTDLNLNLFECGGNFAVGYSRYDQTKNKWDEMSLDQKYTYHYPQKTHKRHPSQLQSQHEDKLGCKHVKKSVIIERNYLDKNSNTGIRSHDEKYERTKPLFEDRIQESYLQSEVKHSQQNQEAQYSHETQNNPPIFTQKPKHNQNINNSLAKENKLIEKTELQKIEKQNESLKQKLIERNEYIKKIREQYFNLIEEVEGNPFLRNIFKLGDENYRKKQISLYNEGKKQLQSQESVDEFSIKLNKLKDLLLILDD